METKRRNCSAASIQYIARGRGQVYSDTKLSHMLWPVTCTANFRMPDAAAGRGTQARPGGCIERELNGFWGSGSGGKFCAWILAFRRRGHIIRSSFDITRPPISSVWKIRKESAGASREWNLMVKRFPDLPTFRCPMTE